MAYDEYGIIKEVSLKRGFIVDLYRRLVIFVTGLFLMSTGIALAVQVKYLGIHPWEVLNVGLYEKIGLSIGTWSIVIGVVLIIVTFILDKSYIHVGTFINVFMVGIVVDFLIFLDILPKAQGLSFSMTLIILSMMLMGLGGGINNAAKLGSGPRDGFMLVISDRSGVSIRKIRIVIETSIVLIGFLIGGPVFIFTFIYTFVQSPIFQYAYYHTEEYLNKHKRA